MEKLELDYVRKVLVPLENIWKKHVKKSFAIRPLTLGDVENYAKQLRIKNFRGVFMRDMLPEKCNKIENGIINLDN